MKNWRESVSGRRWSVSGLDPVRGWTKLDQSIIVYRVQCGDVFGGSEPRRIVKQVQDFGERGACLYQSKRCDSKMLKV